MKQELLKWIYENKVGRPSVFGLGTVETVYMDDLIEMINELEEPQVTNEQAWNKIAETYPETAQNLRITLDHAVYGHEAEPQKVKVPTFVAEYFNYCIVNERTLAEALSGLDRDFKIPDFLYPAIKWLEDSINQNIFAQAWLYGYEVEEEPKWVVKHKDDCLYFEKFDEDKYDFSAIWTYLDEPPAFKFTDRAKAEAVATLVDGTVEKV